MHIANAVRTLREGAGYTQERFAELFGVSQQSVQKWESGAAVPELKKLVAIAKHFSVSLDALVLGNDRRTIESMQPKATLKPSYQNIPDWEFYASDLLTEYRQSTEEGLDLSVYEGVFSAVALLPKGEIKKKLGDVLFQTVLSAPSRAEFPFVEPSDLPSIQALRKPFRCDRIQKCAPDQAKVSGAWWGRICGCMLGKSVEGIHTDELIPFLKTTDNYPMRRYIYRKDLEKTDLQAYQFPLAAHAYADEIDGMPVDDDTNYVVLAQEIVQRYGREFTPSDVASAWLQSQSKDAYCTAERVAFCNFVKGFQPPESAIYQNPYREWIGAQIRGDYFGYINPGQPSLAAEMAWRDGCISHVKNGIYGEMFVAAMLAAAASTCDITEILQAGLAEIPHTSRLYQKVMSVFDGYRSGVSQSACFTAIHQEFDEFVSHDWCHVIPNAMIVTASLLYGWVDFGKAICMAVECGFDTDCNGATVGSVWGMAHGESAILKAWTEVFHNRLHTSIFGVGTVAISGRIQQTMQHMPK